MVMTPKDTAVDIAASIEDDNARLVPNVGSYLTLKRGFFNDRADLADSYPLC